MTTEEIVRNSLGTMGCYQIWITFLIFLHKYPVATHQLVVVLVAPPVGEFNCSDSTLDKCDQNCPSHEFDKTIWYQTIIHEWDLVCDRAYLVSVVQSCVMFGILLGNVSFGYLADRFGRRGPMVAAMIIQTITGVGAAYAPSLWLYTLLRTLATVAIGGTMLTAFALLMEYIDKKYRAVFGILFTLPFHISHASLGVIGYLSRRWDTTQLIISWPSAFLIAYLCLLPESPRWLLTMGKTERVIKQLEKAAKCNKRPIDKIRDEVEAATTKVAGAKASKGGNIVDLFKTKRMRLKTFCLIICWWVIAMVFYGVAQYMGRIAGDPFLNIGMSGFIQCPGNLFGCWVVGVLGRKWSIVLSYLTCGVPLLIICFLPRDPAWPIQVCGCISIMGIALSFSLIYLYSGELFPTVVRSVGMGLCSMFGRFGSMTSPFVMHLEEVATWLPPAIFSAQAFTATFITLIFLPETMGVTLPDTISEADEL